VRIVNYARKAQELEIDILCIGDDKIQSKNVIIQSVDAILEVLPRILTSTLGKR
jgi:hypothetical protein